MKIKQGTIISVSFDPTIGHEEKKKRPALVVSANTLNEHSTVVLVCPISHANNYPLHIKLPEGLLTDGMVLCQHIRSLDIEKRGYKIIENVPNEFMQEISSYLKSMFDNE